MKFNDAYRTVFEKRKKIILLKSPPHHSLKKKCAWNFNVFIPRPKLKQNKQ